MPRLKRGVGIRLWEFLGFALWTLNAAAVYALAVKEWGWPGLLALLMATVLVVLRIYVALVPLAIWGMIAAWSWPWWAAALVGLWPLVLFWVFFGSAAAMGAVSGLFSRR